MGTNGRTHRRTDQYISSIFRDKLSLQGSSFWVAYVAPVGVDPLLCTGSPIRNKKQTPHRVRAVSQGRILRTRDHSTSWHSMYSYHGHWTDDCHGPLRKSYQNFRIGKVFPLPATTHRRIQKTRPNESKETSGRGRGA
jgi:hypothetical protein